MISLNCYQLLPKVLIQIENKENMRNQILKILIDFSFLVATISYAGVFNTL